MAQIEAMVRMTKKTRLRTPMIRVPVFNETPLTQQFDTFGRVTMVKQI